LGKPIKFNRKISKDENIRASLNQASENLVDFSNHIVCASKQNRSSLKQFLLDKLNGSSNSKENVKSEKFNG